MSIVKTIRHSRREKSNGKVATLPAQTPHRSEESETSAKLIDIEVPTGSAKIRVLRLAEVLQITGLGKTTIYQLQRAGDFPQRVKMTATSVGWIEHEVRSWVTARMEARP
jgi:prophage regulatory protein